jgi:hypothetical protein
MRYFPILLTCLLAGAAFAAEHDHDPAHGHEQHGTHVHGEAQLLVALDGQALELELISPAMNVVGFEHPPHNAAQIAALRDAVEQLEQATRLFDLPADARCELLGAEVETSLTAEPEHHAKHGHDHGETHHEDHAHERHGAEDDGHAEFHARYRYRCQRPGRIDGMTVRLFRPFPGLQRIHAQAISPRGQQRAELDPDHNRLPL